jgi:hypothetical protein
LDGSDSSPDYDLGNSSFPRSPLRKIIISDRPAITIRSLTRRIDLFTPLASGCEWMLLLIPDGSTDAQVLEWAEATLPPAAVEELRSIIEREAR